MRLSTSPTIAGRHATTHEPGGVDPVTGIPPAAHVLATTGPHTDTLPLTDLAVGVQGQIIHRGAADWEVLAVGNAADVLTSGGAGADVSWVAPGAPGAHENTHVAGGVDDIDSALDARAIALTAQGEIVYHAAGANTLAVLAVGVAGQALLTGGAAANPTWGAPAPAVHAASHLDGAADEIDAADLAGTGGAAGEIIESDGAALSYVEPDGRYVPAAHTLATTGPHNAPLPLIDLEVGVQGEVIHRGAADWEALAVGAAGEALLSGGAGANVSWGAPATQAHVLDTTGPHTGTLLLTDLEVGARGEIITRTVADWAALAVGAVNQALLSGGAGADVSWGAPPPAAHHATHEPGGADEVQGIDMPYVPGADETGHGLEQTLTVGENVDAGEVCYKKADGKYWLADANQAASMPALVMAMEDILANAAGRMLRIGPYRQDAWNWTVGDGEANLLFVSAAAPGAIVQLANQPAGAGDQVQVVGHVETVDSIYFNPSYELVEIA